ncbi:hypothetical protein PIB30_092643, partial [Stylosanthes scabra]|nr:hypothetical protein [Stylosanthes scabra]
MSLERWKRLSWTWHLTVIIATVKKNSKATMKWTMQMKKTYWNMIWIQMWGDVANALANEFPFQEASFMRVLDEEAMKEPEFAEDMNPGPTYVPGGEFAIGMEFNSRESVIKAVKEYTISRGVDYW